MKKWILILMCFIAPLLVIAQDEEDGSQQGGKIQERMREYIQTKLSLTKAESERFAPVFVCYSGSLRKRIVNIREMALF